MPIFSFAFVGLLVAVFLGIYLCNKRIRAEGQRVRVIKWILLVASYLFVAYADYRFALILAAITIVVWLCGKDRRYIKFGIIASVLALGLFKYTDFFVESVSRLLGKNAHTALRIILPMGISFYVFSAIGYLVDVHRGKLESRSLLDVALYLSFFSKITSGPIQKSQDFFEQMDLGPCVGGDTFSKGIQIFGFGLFKKMVLADHLGVFVNQVYDAPLAFSGATVILAVLAYSLQIYFDFSGYSDMAIGVAKILGINLPRNFNLPYLSRNVTEFWKRWHISLSAWLQEYVYIPLGGNRKGKIRTYVNLMLTMIIGGIWHGPSWTYVIWGLLHGVALIAHKIWMKFTRNRKRRQTVVGDVLSILVTFVFTSFCWVFFRAESVDVALQILGQIVAFREGIWHPYLWLFVGLVLLVICSAAAYIKSEACNIRNYKQDKTFVNGYYPLLDLKKFWHLVIFFVFWGLILGLAFTGESPFIYGAY